MNAPRHDPAELARALDALGELASKDRDLQKQIDMLRMEKHRLDDQLKKARDLAGKMLRREGGAVVHNGCTWRVNENGYVAFEPVQVNLDALREAQRGQETALHLTPPASEKAA